jgi:hypothetical protein
MNHLTLDFTGWTKEDFRYQSSRREWAAKLGISVKTLQRYEEQILYRDKSKIPKEGVDRVFLAFYWRDRRGHYKLDFYQKTILWIIKMLSFGEAYANQKLSYPQIELWFKQIDRNTGKKRILSLSPPLVREMLDI